MLFTFYEKLLQQKLHIFLISSYVTAGSSIIRVRQFRFHIRSSHVAMLEPVEKVKRTKFNENHLRVLRD